MAQQQHNRRNNDALIMSRLSAVENDCILIKKSLAENTSMTLQTHESIVDLTKNTEDLVEIFHTAKGGIKTAAWLGKAVKWLALTGAAGIGFYAAVVKHFGH